MRNAWSASAPANEFLLPREVFQLSLGHGPLLVYLYLICRKSSKHGAGKMSCSIVGKAVGMCEKTVRTHLRTLCDAQLVRVEQHGQTFSYTLNPIQGRVCEHRNTTFRSKWFPSKQTWLTGEKFDAVFPVPDGVFQLNLKPGEALVYLYLHYQKGVRSGQCWPSYATIGAAVGMSRKTVQKHVQALVDKCLIQAEETMIYRKDGRSYNGNLLYTVKPMEQVLAEREREFLAELKLAEAQRKWAQRCQESNRSRSAF